MKLKPIRSGEAINWDELVRLTLKPAEQPVLPFDEKKRPAESRFKASPTSLEGKDTGKIDAHVRR